MDIEQLSKAQVVLLTLLITFVTSIATGIVTVSLMQQAPPAIAQTVNRVVEHTIEKIVPTGQTASVVTQEKTVVVKESDLISQAVAKVSPSVVRLYSSDVTSPMFLGLGVVIDSSGRIVSDTGAMGDAGDAVAVLADGTRARAFVTSRDLTNGIAFLQAATSTMSEIAADIKPITWNPATLSVSNATLGESIVALSGKSTPHIAEGIVTSITPRSSAANVIDTDIADASIVRGSPLIDVNGTLIGISTEISRGTSGSAFVASTILLPPPATKDASANK